MLLGGFTTTTDNSAVRFDAIMPVPTPKAPALRLGVEIGYDHEAAAIPELAIEAYSAVVAPTVYYDWKLPIRSSAGDFVASIQGGLGLFIARIKLDEPFMPGNFETLHGYCLHFAGALEFRARAGWVVSFQPLGTAVAVGEVDAPANLEITYQTPFELALLAGYQFR